MKYLPYLIPKKSKVLPDYFKESEQINYTENSTIKSVLYIISSILFFLGLWSLPYPALALILIIIALALFPPSHRWLEKTGQFEFNRKIQIGVILLLFCFYIPLKVHYNSVDEKFALAQKLQKEKAEKAEQKKIAEQKRIHDSLDTHIIIIDKLIAAKKYNNALEEISLTHKFISNKVEENALLNRKSQIALNNSKELIKSGKYQKALPEINNLILNDPNNSELLLNRAICLSKTGKTEEAVTDLKKSIKLGNTDASKLHDKINPIKKRVAYYVTKCCDGSESSAKGRGACSHHGGVCDWNEPVYEEYRKYE